MMFRMARTPSIADLLDEAANKGTTLKVDQYLATLQPDIRDRVIAHLRSKMSSRLIAMTISADKSTEFTLSASAVDKWREVNLTADDS